MSNFMTMVLTLGGTFVVAIGLLYLSLLTGQPKTRGAGRRIAAETTAAMAATSDQVRDRRDE